MGGKNVISTVLTLRTLREMALRPLVLQAFVYQMQRCVGDERLAMLRIVSPMPVT
jgi:hypothetical protein